MLTYNMLFEKEVRKLILQRIEAAKENLSYGHTENYQKEVGIISGLRMSLDMCDEANTSMANT